MSQRVKNERERWDVIVAEDNDDHALLIEMALERAADIPVDVRRARNGEEAVKLLEESPPDLLLLDLKMPGMAGHEVLERVKGDDELRKIPVFANLASQRGGQPRALAPNPDGGHSLEPGWVRGSHQSGD